MRAGSPAQRPQSAAEALDVMQLAERAQCAVEVNEAGDLTLLYERVGKADREPAALRPAVEAVLGKMRSETGSLLALGAPDCQNILTHDAPSLQRFALKGQLGTLREEWQALSARFSERLLERRAAEAKDMGACLPAGVRVSPRDGEVTTFHHQFSKADQASLLDYVAAQEATGSDRKPGLSATFGVDANRCCYSFLDGESLQTYKEGHGAEVVAALFRFAHGDPSVAACLSLLANQRLLKPLIDIASALPTNSGESPGLCNPTHPQRDKDTVFSLRREPNGDLTLACLYLRKSATLMRTETGQSWPVNRGAALEGPPSQQNFTLRIAVELRLRKEDLERGELRPAFTRSPTYTLCICPDWASIDQRLAKQAPQQH